MIFNSLEFLIFFPIVVIAYFILPQKYRWFLLLLASYIFYMAWNPIYIVLIVVSTLIDYYCGLQIPKHKGVKRKLFLILSLLVNLGILISFKYSNMLISTINSISHGNLNTFSLLLPMGISFYTFQTLSYTIDVYSDKRKPEKHLGYFALYVTYFPQLVAGPIERSDRLLPQLKKAHKFDYIRITSGLKRMAWGFFKKLVIADNLAKAVDKIFNNVSEYNGLTLFLATVFFSYQIYCDFSGYTDIAIGTSQIMGIKLMENFKRPYLSKSIKEFWTRWHISLSTWFRDYLYIPLGGSRKSKYRTYINVFIVFLISGLWHGADWKFVVWGGIHALFQLIETITKNLRKKFWNLIHLDGSKIQSVIQWGVTMLIVLFAWIFFRANSLNEAIVVVKTIFIDISSLDFFKHLGTPFFILFESKLIILVMGFSIILLELNHILEEFLNKTYFTLFANNTGLRWAIYCLIIIIILFFGRYGQEEFIYFQF